MKFNNVDFDTYFQQYPDEKGFFGPYGGAYIADELKDAMREITDADIVASGGAGTMEHFAEAAEAGAPILLAASVFHFHVIGIPELKAFLKERGFAVRI